MSDWIGMLGPTPAYAQEAAAGGGAGSFVASFAPILLIFALFWLLLIRPQQKRQKELRNMLEALKKGDKVITNGGLLGTVSSATKEVVTLQIADQVRVKVLRTEIMGMQDAMIGDDKKD